MVLHSSARRSPRKQRARKLRQARTATVQLRWQTVQLRDPKGSQPAARLQLVHVREPLPPADCEALEWFLLTTLPVQSQADAERMLQWYRLRWRIEDWHRILKSGCKVEYLGHRTGQRIERAVTIKAVIVWRLTALTLLGRETPQLPPEVIFTEVQIRVLQHFAARPRRASWG